MRKMMHYRKGENIEKELTKEELPFDDFLPKNTEFLWMHVNGGTKVSNVLNYAKNALKDGEHKHIVWSGNGGGVVKTISCAEILKRTYPLYQVTRMCYRTVEEHWKPQLEGLEEIVVNRQIPSLHIFMSLEPIDDSVRGLQKPNTKTNFWTHNKNEQSTSKSSNNNRNDSHKQRNNNRSHRRSNFSKSTSQQQEQQQRQPQTNLSENQETEQSNEANISGRYQQRNHKNPPKRKKPYQDRGHQHIAKEDNNSNSIEITET